MHRYARTLVLAAALAPGAFAPSAAQAAPDDPFPPSTALAEGVSPDALARLAELVRGFVDDGEVVGAELHVIKGGRTILHEAYGWADREAERPMQVDGVFCVRSMTKPVIGAAVLMLIDDDLLELDTRVAEHLPAFDVEGKRGITVEHLLTHTSGLPMSSILAADLRALGGIGAVAELGGAAELEFEPGAGFRYSDQGTDTLTALIEAVTGAPAAEFVGARVLAPLGMTDSACVLEEGHPLRARGLVKYFGSRGAWTPFWGPDEPPLFPFFLGSQGLYATTTDYARFLAFWLRKGRAGGERLLGLRLARKALEPGPHPMNGTTGFPDLRAEYGYLMQLWTGPAGDDDAAGKNGRRDLVAFGHGGSDGTHAWAFPREDALVLYFTQSRNNRTGLQVEEALGELLLGAPFDPNLAAPPFEDYLGYYREVGDPDDLYRAIVRDGDDLALEVMGRAVVPMRYVGEDRWKLVPEPTTVLAFERASDGAVTGYAIGEHREERFEPAADLPDADALAARVASAHGLARLEAVGPLRMRGELVNERPGFTGEIRTLYAWPDRYRLESTANGESEELAIDGERVWHGSSRTDPAELEGQPADLLLGNTPFERFGDWRGRTPRYRVIQVLEDGEAIVVRAGDLSAPASTLFVHAETGLVRRVDSMTWAQTMGRVGQRMRFDDYRDVSGMMLPFRTRLEFAHPLIGEIVTTITEVEVGAELPAGAFALPD